VAVVPTAELTMNVHENTAGEARCTIAFDGLRAELKPLPFDSWSLRAAMAGARAFQIAGALDRVLEMTAGYVQEREQFGRPIARFQAVQQSLAELGGQVATARAATTLVSEAFGKPEGVAVLAAAKIRSGEAVGIASRIAHQAHGAIGFTREYDLQRFTRRLWGWREDYGNETNWAKWLGLAITAHQSENHAVPLWEMIAGGLRLPSMVGSI
jgi:acyl-CoA dehydrogenase